MDRVAVLTKHLEALTASILNPAPRKATLLPLLAALSPASLVTEGLLRPRMPVIKIGNREEADTESEDEHVDDEIEHQFANETAMREVFDGLDEHPPPQQPSHKQTLDSESTESRIEDEKTQDLGANPEDESIAAQSTAHTPTLVLSRKRSHEEEPGAELSPKRARIEEMVVPQIMTLPTSDTLVTAEAAFEAIPARGSEFSASNANEQMVSANPAEEDSEDNDDESTFEIPPLVMRTDFEDDDEEEEEEAVE